MLSWTAGVSPAHDHDAGWKPAVRKTMTRHWSGAPPALRQIQLAPHRNVVGRVGPAAFGLVDAGGGEPIGGLRREQEVVDAQAPVLRPAAGLVVPERVD